MTATTATRSAREQALRGLSQLPPFPVILNKLIATLACEEASFVEIGDLIEKDTVVAGNVLRLVNSALYGRRANVSSVRHAVSLLGINKLRNAALGMSVARMWNQVHTPPDWSVAKFNLHSVATAMLADAFAQRVSVEYPEGAFVAGLFHDLGRLLIAIALPEEHAAISRLYQAGDRTLCDCEREVIGVTHAELSSDALGLWKLPESVRIAALRHHAAELPARPDGALHLGALVSAANQYVNGRGLSIDARFSTPDRPSAGSIEALGIGGNLAALIEDFEKELESIRWLF